jgi:hypothetical protein
VNIYVREHELADVATVTQVAGKDRPDGSDANLKDSWPVGRNAVDPPLSPGRVNGDKASRGGQGTEELSEGIQVARRYSRSPLVGG